MTKAELKTLRESMGITPPMIAAKAGVHHNIVWRQESPTSSAQVSADVQAAILAFAKTWNAAAERVAAEALRTGIIPRPTTPKGFAKLAPELRNWPDRSLGLFLAEVQRRANTGIEYTEE